MWLDTVGFIDKRPIVIGSATFALPRGITGSELLGEGLFFLSAIQLPR